VASISASRLNCTFVMESYSWTPTSWRISALSET
jgi:hypothetical protein